MNNPSAFHELKKAQDILMDAVDKTARTNLDAVEKLLELNKNRFTDLSDISNPGEFVSRQAAAVKDYMEFLSSHVEALTSIGHESREQLTELSQELAKEMDFTSFFPFAETTTKNGTKSKAA